MTTIFKDGRKRRWQRKWHAAKTCLSHHHVPDYNITKKPFWKVGCWRRPDLNEVALWAHQSHQAVHSSQTPHGGTALKHRDVYAAHYNLPATGHPGMPASIQNPWKPPSSCSEICHPDIASWKSVLRIYPSADINPCGQLEIQAFLPQWHKKTPQYCCYPNSTFIC